MRTTQACQLLGILLLSSLAIVSAQDVFVVLAQYPQFSKFNELLNSTGVRNEVNMRSSMTIFLPEDGILNSYLGSHPSYTTQMVADVIRYHCLLQYFGATELQAINAQNGGVITTLYQTTGRANGLDGFINITAQPDGSRSISPATPGAPIQANIITNITQYPYNYSFLQISGVLEPLGLAAAQLAPTTPPSYAPAPAPMAPVPAPVVPVVAPVVSPVSSPASVPAMAPTPVVAPVVAPVPAPVAQVPAPVPAPATTPVPAPATTPVPAPDVVAPSPPMINGPAANAPVQSPISSSAFSLRFNVAALVASVLVAALLL